MCRAWHQANAEADSSHYEDVVERFRREQPDYQRRWRWSQRLREIREQTGVLGGAVLVSLRGLLGRAEALSQSALGMVQSGVLAGERLGRAVRAVRSTIAALEQLEASTTELRALGL